jgi:hypothetical protein
MKNLKILREGWIDIEQESAKLASGLTIQEKVRVFLICIILFFHDLKKRKLFLAHNDVSTWPSYNSV